MKSDKGVTILMLVITIIVLMIIAGISINTSVFFMNNVRVGRIVANMELVQAKVEIIYEEYQFQGENRKEEVLVGDLVQGEEIRNQISDKDKALLQTHYGEGIFESNLWYKWDRNTLKEQGLDMNMLDAEDAIFWVNYEYSEIIYSIGTIIDNTSYYSKVGLESVLAREI